MISLTICGTYYDLFHNSVTCHEICNEPVKEELLHKVSISRDDVLNIFRCNMLCSSSFSVCRCVMVKLMQSILRFLKIYFLLRFFYRGPIRETFSCLKMMRVFIFHQLQKEAGVPKIFSLPSP